MTACHVIVGAGESGVAAALAMRRCGYAGRIVLVAGENDAPYERPPLSKAFLLGADAAPPAIVALDRLADEHIQFERGMRAIAIDGASRRLRVRDIDGGAADIAYDRLLLATGSRARPLGAARVLRTARDAMDLRAALRGAASLVVVGGGVIGLEVAATAARMGLSVTVVEAGERVMARCVPAGVSRRIESIHRANGVRLVIGTGARTVEAGPGGARIELAGGTVVEADLALAGIGCAPRTELAEAAGCHADDGIVVDRFGATTVEGIYAAGDCARLPLGTAGRLRRLETWRHAREHGAAVGANMCGAGAPYEAVPWFWSDQYEHNLQVAGSISDADEEIVRPGPGAAVTLLYRRSDRLTGAVTLDAGADMRPAIRLIEAGTPVEREALKDSSIRLRELAGAVRREAA